MKKGIWTVIFGVVMCANPCLHADDYIFSEGLNDPTQSDFYFKVNPDSVTVAIISGAYEHVAGGGQGARINLTLPVKDPSTGKTYTITVLGSGEYSLTLKGTITPNIERIEDFALSHPYSAFVKMDEKTELKYLGAEAFCAFLPTMKIAKNGVLNYQYGGFKRLELGEGAELRVDNNIRFDPKSITALFSSKWATTMTIYNHSKVPQKIQSDVLDNPPFFKNEESYKLSTLYVPVGSVEAYRNDPEWSKFENILEFESEKSPASIGDIKDDTPDNFNSWAEPGLIVLEVEASEVVDVYSLQGLLIGHELLAPGRNEIPVQKGLYIVKPASGRAQKVLVP